MESHSPHPSTEEYTNHICPSCGAFGELDEQTGWCASCRLASVPSGTCIRCGRDFPPDREGRRICSTCRKYEWFYKNGDALDRAIADGHLLDKAVQIVSESLRPYCLSCGDPIYSGSTHYLFCKKTQRCRKAARSYKYYTYERGLTAQEALAKVQENLYIETLTGVT